MRLEHLSASEFRNLERVEIDFSPRFTILHGHNGAGKTNVLEALYLISTVRSFRSAELGPLVRHGQTQTRVEVTGRISGLGVTSTLCVTLERGTRSTRRAASADGKLVRSGAAFYGRLPAILFTPEDLNVLRGSPGGRRRFLDRVLFARDRAHIGDIQTYEKLLRSRNHVLRDADQARGTRDRDAMLEAYELRLSETGARIWTRRDQLVEELRGAVTEGFAQIHGKAPQADITYSSHVQGFLREQGRTEDAERATADVSARAQVLHRALQDRRGLDLMRGTTSLGPHRDDFEMTLNGQSAAKYASQGQSRALVLAFKIAELQTSRAALGRAPVLLLDDVSSELDPTRTGQLFQALAREVEQCVLTTTSPRFIPLPDELERSYLAVAGGVITTSGATLSG